MSEYIKTNDTVYFTANFYHPQSGYSVEADSTPHWYVYESGATLLPISGIMSARTTSVGSYWGKVVASSANGFVADRFYDVQVSGTVDGVSGFVSVKEFVLDDIFDSNIIQVSGLYVSSKTLYDANIVSVSGVQVDLAAFNTGGTAPTAVSIRQEIDLNSTKLIAISGSVAGLAGEPMRGTDNAALKTDLTMVSGTIPTTAGIAGAVWDANTGSYGSATTSYGYTLENMSTTVAAGVATSLTAVGSGITAGNHFSGSYTDTYLSDGVLWTTRPAAAGLNVYLQFTAGATQTINNTTIRGNFASSAGRYANVYAYNWTGASGWDQLSDSVSRMNNTSTTTSYTYTLLSAHQKADGSIRIGFQSPSTTGTDRLNIDQCIVGVASAGASAADIANAVWMKTAAANYSDGVWIDTIYGQSGVSIQDGYGTSTKPTKYYDQALTISDTLGTKRLYLKPGSNIGLTQNHDNWRFIGEGKVNLGGQSIGNAVFENIYSISGVSTGDDAIINHCGINNITLEHCYFNDCNFKGITNFVANQDYFLLNCNDATSSEYGLSYDAPIFVFASGASAYIRNWHGGIQLNNMGATNICMLDGIGRVVIDHTSVSGTISVRGHFPTITGEDAFQGTITQTSRFSTDNTANANIISVSGISVSLNSFHTDLTSLDTDIYFADIKYISDTTNSSDEFVVHWFKNDQPVSSGSLTNPRISVYNTSTGAAVFAGEPMSYASTNLGVVRYNQSPMLVGSGEPYLVETSGIIDTNLRTWRTIIGIDLL
jgi:hypothetical protein